MLIELAKNKLKKHNNSALMRKRLIVHGKSENKIIVGNKSLLNFSSNDYLGISTHAAIQKAFIRGVQQYGMGSGSAPIVSGFYHPHQLLEEKMAEFLGRDRAVLFNSGYVANIGVLNALTNRHQTIFADKYCHASILDGIQLSRAKYFRFCHNDMQQLKVLLEQERNSSLVVTESVFSMEGKLSPIDQLVKLTKKYSVSLIVDDAHGVGVLGATGRGISEHYQLNKADIDCLITPLGKSFGSMGAIVSGDQDIIENLIQFSRTYSFSTMLPPAIAAATLASLSVIQHETWRREKLLHLTQYFITQARQRNIVLMSDDLTPIKSILVSDNQKALNIKECMMNKGVLLSCIRPPTVPLNTARLRISLNCWLTENDIDYLFDLLMIYLC